MKIPIPLQLVTFGLLALILVSVGTAFAAGITVSSSNIGKQSVLVTANDVKPSACAALNLTNLISGSETLTGTEGNDLIVGSSGADMIDGLSNWMSDKGYARLTDFQGLAVPSIQKWENLDLNHFIRAHIDQTTCIGCELCFIACEDGAHQALALAPKNGKRLVEVKEDMCVGCNLCSLVCPVHGCITMRKVENGAPSVSWKQYSSGAGTLAPRPQHYHTVEE